MPDVALTRNSAPAQALALVGWLALTGVAAAMGGIASADAPGFYAQLSKPGWAPPAWLFGPVWTVLYLMMGVSAWLVWRAHDPQRGERTALGLYAAQLVPNALWSWLFFGWRQGALACLDILLLLALLAVMIPAFWRISRIAALLLLPYFAWVSFAAALTAVVWQRNPGLL
ncbi:TspO/MBR family protein [Roseateles sp. DC23W]|uniref:TspO/MBR family protein n=1 Tax=Pelomonas dachongensis TaxID=3299029 RepID=A0ABW7ESP7_9BURK